MAKVTLVFKRGAAIDIDVNAFSAKKDRYGSVIGITWGMSGKDKPIEIDPNELVAVIERGE